MSSLGMRAVNADPMTVRKLANQYALANTASAGLAVVYPN